MAKQNGTRSSSRSAIDDTRFWKQRLFHPGYTREGLRVDQPELAVRIQKSGVRHTFNLNTANRDKAARKAAEIYAHLVAAGWSDTLRRYAPKTDTERLVRRVDELARRARQSTDPKNFSHLKKVPAKNCGGNPKPDRVGTCYIEWANLTAPTHCQRLARITPAFSKKVGNFKSCHRAPLGILQFRKKNARHAPLHSRNGRGNRNNPPDNRRFY